MEQKFPLNRGDAVHAPAPNGNGKSGAPNTASGKTNGAAAAGQPQANGTALSPSRQQDNAIGQAAAAAAAAAAALQYTITIGNEPNIHGDGSEKPSLQLANGGLALPMFNGGSGGPNGKQCEIHHNLLNPTLAGGRTRIGAASRTDSNRKKVNFCRAWLNKFPSRSKRIDVISRIFFPKMFALFNLVYWTTYLFREDDIVQN